MPENTKRSGCGCGGCLLFCFYTIIILLGGMFLSSLINTDWDLDSAKDRLIKDSQKAAFIVKNIATELITGEESTTPTPDLEQSSVKTLVENGNKSYSKAMELLKNAHEVTGDERQKILRELQNELQKSLSLYKAAEEKDKGNQELLKKISHLQGILKKMNP